MGMSGLMACASLVFLMGCDLDDDSENVGNGPVSYVSLYNASPDAPELSIVVDNRQINSYPFEYSDYTGYLRFYTGSRNLQFGPYGANNIVVDTTLTLEDEKVYSIFVADEFAKASLVVLNDESPAPAEGNGKVRVINLGPDNGRSELRFSGDSTALAPGQAFKNASAFVEMESGEYDFEVQTSEGTILELPNVSIASGQFYTVIIRGYEEPPTGNTNVLSAQVIVN
jgi:Domain of unknown function (DUF4397)